MIVVAYLTCNVTHEFPARNIDHGREVAKRIVTEGLWVKNGDGSETFFPINQVYKVVIRENTDAE